MSKWSSGLAGRRSVRTCSKRENDLLRRVAEVLESRVHLSASPVAAKLAQAAAVVSVASLSSETPANDNFADAIAIDALPANFSGSNAGATWEDGEPSGHDYDGGNHSLWWKYTAASSASIEVDTNGSDFDTVLAVYSGDAFDSLSFVTSDDDSGDDLCSTLSFDAAEGTTYYIALDGYGDYDTGNFQLSVVPMVPPSNDNFADRMEITSLPFTASFSNRYATTEEQEPLISGEEGGHSLWYTWTAPESGLVQLDPSAANPSFGVMAGAYTGDSLDSLTPVAETTYGRVSFTVEAGTTYQIAVDGLWGDTGDFTLSFGYFVPAANDNFADRADITEAADSFGGNLSASTLEEGEPDYFGDSGSSVGSLWWTWTAPASGTVKVDSEGTHTNIVMAVYTGDALDNLNEQAFSGNDYDYDGGYWMPATASFDVTAGTQYQIVAAGYSGEATLHLRFWAPPANDNIANAQPIDGSSATVQGATAGATAEEDEPDHQGMYPLHSVWYTWTAPESGILSLHASSSDFDPVLGVYIPTLYTGLQEVDDYGADSSASAWFHVTAGTTYNIAVDSWDDQVGDFTLDLQLYTAPANDNFADRSQLEGSDVSVDGTLTAATLEDSEPDHTGWGDESLVSTWYSWTAPASGTVQIGGASTADWMGVAVYTGESLSELSQVNYSEGYSDEYSEVYWTWDGGSFSVTEGTTYQIAVVGYQGDFTLNLQLYTPPANDNFADRAQLEGSDVVVDGTLNAATVEEGEPDHTGWGNDGLASTWWTWTAPSSGTLEIGVEGSNWTGVAVYTGDALPDLYQLSYAEGYDEDGWYWPGQSLHVTEGATYQIAAVGESGDFQMHLQLVAAPANDNFADATVVDGATATITGTNVAATYEDGEPGDWSGSVWYSWTAPSTGQVQIGVTDSDFPAWVTVYTGDSVGSLQQVVYGSSVAYEAQQGVTYRIAVDGQYYTTGSFTLNLALTGHTVTLDGGTVAENSAAGTTVGTLGVDATWSGEMTYTLVDGEGAGDNGLFAIDGNTLVVNGDLDFEARSTYSVRVRAASASGAYVEQVLTISVTDVDDRTAWVVDGTDGDDVIGVATDGTDLVVKINGEETRRPMGHVLSLTINGRGGNDAISAVGESLLVPVTLDGGMGNDTITGSEGADFIRGDGDDDSISGGAGDDTIMGNTGNDTLYGEDGMDLVQGGLGDDLVDGGLQNDCLYGGNGSDAIYGQEGDDYIAGKGKADMIYGGAGNDTIWGGAGADLIHGDDGDDWIDRGYYSFSDTIDGGDGLDSSASDDNDQVSSIEELLA